MKQNITKEQWDEIPEDQQVLLIEKMYKEYYIPYDIERFVGAPKIGQMIEFLGEDNWYKNLFYDDCNYRGDSVWTERSYEGELCDALWEAVKYKLNKTI